MYKIRIMFSHSQSYQETPMLTYAAVLYRGVKFGVNLLLHPYFVYASSEGSNEPAHLRARLSLRFNIISTKLACVG